MVPELVAKLAAAGYEIAVQSGAGAGALISDDAYRVAGAAISDNPFPGAVLAVSVQPLADANRAALDSDASTISFYPIGSLAADLELRWAQRLTTFGMEYVPRISRAQSMDALSSQSLVAGYRGAIVAAGRLRQFFPLSMTAAGTVRPAQVVVLGAGVAGLEAIATCRRLGAVVKGYDVRVAAAEEIRSMGASAIDLGLPSLDGLEVARHIRRQPHQPRQLVALTGYGGPEDRQRCLAAGFDSHLVKPVDPVRLKALLES